MNEREYNVRCAEAGVKDAESRLAEARRDAETGFRKASADLDKAKAQYEQDCGQLRGKVERAAHDLDRAKAWLTHKQAEFTRGFDSN